MLRYLKIDKSLPWQNISFKSSFARMWFTATSLGVTPKRCRRVAPSAARGHRVLGSLPFRSSSAPGRCQSGGTTKLPHVFLYVLKSIAINKKRWTNMHQSQCLILWHSLQVRLDTASPWFRIQMVDLFTVKFWVVLRRWFFSGTLPLKAGEAPQQSPIKAWFRRILNITGRQNLNHWFSGELVALFFQHPTAATAEPVRSLQLTCFKIEEVMGISRPSLRSHLHRGIW